MPYFVAQINATDKDEGNNGLVTYSITNTNEGIVSAFQIDQSTGQLTLSRSLTQNDVGIVYLDVQASDNALGAAKR